MLIMMIRLRIKNVPAGSAQSAVVAVPSPKVDAGSPIERPTPAERRVPLPPAAIDRARCVCMGGSHRHVRQCRGPPLHVGIVDQSVLVQRQSKPVRGGLENVAGHRRVPAMRRLHDAFSKQGRSASQDSRPTHAGQLVVVVNAVPKNPVAVRFVVQIGLIQVGRVRCCCCGVVGRRGARARRRVRIVVLLSVVGLFEGVFRDVGSILVGSLHRCPEIGSQFYGCRVSRWNRDNALFPFHG
mmetsp:Transcript_20004/g.46766  ORF Transcript_20004/g.46766 Transcript_20004/m.46766 type:complete len:240 (+) Transcript_20004:3212-3931(+)